MGKIEISEDLRNKLNKVLSYKSTDIGDTAVGPAPSWKPPNYSQPQVQPQVQPQEPKLNMPSQPLPYNYLRSEKNKKKKNKIKYYKITKIVFLSSFVAGIGLTLGLKIANILFY